MGRAGARAGAGPVVNTFVLCTAALVVVCRVETRGRVGDGGGGGSSPCGRLVVASPDAVRLAYRAARAGGGSSTLHFGRRTYTVRLYSPLSPLDARGSALAASFLHARLARQTAMAYVSSLGGGYFLTHHHADAVRAAAVQMALACADGDVSTFTRTWTHFAYIGSSSGCDGVARWAAATAVRLASPLERSDATRRAAHVCHRYVRRLQRARERGTVELSDREAVHRGKEARVAVDDVALMACVARALRTYVRVEGILGLVREGIECCARHPQR